MRTFITGLALSMIALSIHAQKTTFWEGGTPGKENSWSEARNWSNDRIPDAFTHVVIEMGNNGHASQPVINVEVEVLSIEIRSSASLSITKSGHLIIDGAEAYTEGISIYGGSLINNGLISMWQIEQGPDFLDMLSYAGYGDLMIDDNVVSRSTAREKIFH